MWNKSKSSSINLNNVTSKGLPTLGTGTYKGTFVGTTGGWITVQARSPKVGIHIEMSTLKVSDLTPGAPIRFEIALESGAIVLLKGLKYQLVDIDGQPLTAWLDLGLIYEYVTTNGIVMAEPKLKTITPVATEGE